MVKVHSLFADLESVDILIVESTCPEMLQETARAAGVHVVNETWLKKSLIHGKMQDRNNPDFLPISEWYKKLFPEEQRFNQSFFVSGYLLLRQWFCY